MEDIMQRMKQLTSSAVLAALALSGVAYAGETHKVEAKTSIDVERPANPNWASGLSRDQIKDLQRQLASRGLYQGKVDGSPGAMTASALRNFQIQQHLENSNGLDAPTRDALGLQWDRQPVSGTGAITVQRTVGNDTSVTTVPAGSSVTVPGTVAGPQMRVNTLNKEQAKILQSRLRELGFYKGEVDGVAGDGTRVALEQYFRTQADLAAQGIISDATVGLFANSPAVKVTNNNTPAK
jgi:peptidoglycan hydrolase-like protein with peptidoglycan-binding domain